MARSSTAVLFFLFLMACSGAESEPADSQPAAEDCAGVAGGTAAVDACGVCDGDGSSCADCAGVPNGDDFSCADCAGVPNGDAIEDACGVCDGDGSTCADCAGVPNGDAVLDYCGVCDGDGSSCTCSYEGFTTVGISANFWDDEAQLLAVSSQTGSYDAISLELYEESLGGLTGPGSYAIDGSNYAECGLCLRAFKNTGESEAESVFYAIRGGVEISAWDEEAGILVAALTDVRMEEVTIDPDSYASTPVQDGASWCLADLTLDSRVDYDCAGVPNGDAVLDDCGVCDGDGIRDACGVCDSDPSNDCPATTVTITTTTDDYPEESSWDLVNADGEVIDSREQGFYVQQFFTEEVAVPLLDGDYCLNVRDSYGDNGLGVTITAMTGSETVELGSTFGSFGFETQLCFTIGPDCAGIFLGSATEDACGVCDTDPSNDCVIDCSGVPNGDDFSCADCAGVPNGDAVVDACGVCDGDGSSCDNQSNLPGRYESCPEGLCQAGLSCIEEYSDQSICLAPCGASNECRSYEACVDDGGVLFSAFVGHCFRNGCVPAGSSSFGLFMGFQEASFGGVCDAADADGTCMPLDTTIPDQEWGICYASDGELSLGDTCDVNALHTDRSGICGGGTVCLGTCVATCVNGETCPEGTTCQSVDIDGYLAPGYCIAE